MEKNQINQGFNAYGQQNVVYKGQPVDPASTIAPPIFAMFELARKEEEISELEQHLAAERTAREAAEKNSLHDFLTGLPNRFALDTYLDTEIPKTKRWDTNKKLCLIFIDVDGLKQVNDCYGHVAGDTLLKTTANFLKQHLRGDDTIYRIGGDEMIIVASGDPKKIAEKIHSMQKELEEKTLRVNVAGNWKEIPLWGFSCGLHICNPDKTAGENYEASDKLMYTNKLFRKDQQLGIREERTREMLDDKALIKAHEVTIQTPLEPQP